jgi:hypothetical protein
VGGEKRREERREREEREGREIGERREERITQRILDSLVSLLS